MTSSNEPMVVVCNRIADQTTPNIPATRDSCSDCNAPMDRGTVDVSCPECSARAADSSVFRMIWDGMRWIAASWWRQ